MFNPTGDTLVAGNTVSDNGYHGFSVRPGSGIYVFSPAQSFIYGNTVCNNAGSGINVGTGPGAGQNFITANKVGAGTAGCTPNAVAGLPSTFDLKDEEMTSVPPTPPGVPCLTNIWTGNFTPGDTFNHVCTTN